MAPKSSVFPSQPPYDGRIPANACCYRCGTTMNLHRHHVLNGPHRDLSEREGLWVYLCADCHEFPFGIHSNRKLKGHRLTDSEHLKWHAQCMWEADYMRRRNCGENAARLAWKMLGKVPLKSYDYVADDDHGAWIERWVA